MPTFHTSGKTFTNRNSADIYKITFRKKIDFKLIANFIFNISLFGKILNYFARSNI